MVGNDNARRDWNPIVTDVSNQSKMEIQKSVIANGDSIGLDEVLRQGQVVGEVGSVQGAAGVGILGQGGRVTTVAINPDDRMKAVRFARLGPGEEARTDQGRKVPLPELDISQFRDHGMPLSWLWGPVPGQRRGGRHHPLSTSVDVETSPMVCSRWFFLTILTGSLSLRVFGVRLGKSGMMRKRPISRHLAADLFQLGDLSNHQETHVGCCKIASWRVRERFPRGPRRTPSGGSKTRGLRLAS